MRSISETSPKPTCDAYQVGLLCVLNIEYDAIISLLDEKHDTPSTPDDPNAYTVGRMGKHNVVIVKFVKSGTNNAATAVTNMLRSFENIRFGLMVGIGGGAAHAPELPDWRTPEILLGDVVVSKPEGKHGGILQYDLGRRDAEGFEPRSHLNSPTSLLIANADKLSHDHRFGGGNMARYIEAGELKLQALGMPYFHFPGRDHDRLFASEYNHPNPKEKNCRGCDGAKVIARASISRQNPVVHYGLIASGNTLLRDVRMRDNMRSRHNVLCFEMEAAGLMNSFPCLVIRGISDYSDSHKNDLWQPYAALTAAAYAKDLLGLIQPQAVTSQEMASELMNRIDLINQSMEASCRTEILKSLSGIDFQHEQQRLYESSVPTGKWLIDSNVFQRWADGAPWQLRCYGETGTGKTYLCARIVHHLQQAKPLSPVIYVYLNDQEGRQTTLDILRSMVKQLLLFQAPDEHPCEIPTTLREGYQKDHLSTTILKQAFEELLGRHDRTYLVVDGFYQCSDDVVLTLKAYPLDLINKGFKLSLLTTTPSDRQAAMQIDCDRCHKEKLSIYFNCACNGGDFDLCLECKEDGIACPGCNESIMTNDTVRVQVQARPHEIELLCCDRLQRASSRDSRRHDIREYPDPSWSPSGTARFLKSHPEMIQPIAEKIERQAQKNFLVAQTWIELLLDLDKQPENGKHLLDLVHTIPVSGLQPHVTRKMEGIKRYGKDREVKLAMDTFFLMMTARQRLTILALQHALALEGNLRAIRKEYLDERVSILKATNGLITIDKAEEEHAYVHFFHGTLPTIFEDHVQEPWVRTAESKMAFLCLKYLKHPDFELHCADIAAYPFSSYVLEHWGDHVRSACLKYDRDTKVESETMQFLTNPDNVRMIIRLTAVVIGQRQQPVWIHEGIDVLHLCAWFDLTNIIRRLKDKSHDMNVVSEYRRTPLRYACARGHMDTVKLLSLESPANDDIIAVIAGIRGTDHSYHELDERVKIIKWQLEKRNLTLNSVFDFGNASRTILMYAMRYQHYDFAERLLLLEKSVDVNVRNAGGYTALWTAVCTSPPPGVPVSPRLGQEDIIPLLLHHGADPNLIYETSTTVLANAVANAKVIAVAALLECNALNLHAEKNIIHIASTTGYPEIIPLCSALQTRGISDINVGDENGLTPLHYAAISKRKSAATTAKALLDCGANPETLDSQGCTPFMLASLLDQKEITQVLSPVVANGSHNPEPESPRTKTLKDIPALALADHGHWSTLQDVIIDTGATRPDLAHRDIVTGETLLHLATRAKQLEILRLLLESETASSDSSSGNFRRLVCNGNVDNRGMTPLQLALAREKKCPDLARLLLKYHDSSCICGISNPATESTEADSDAILSPLVTLQGNEIEPGSIEKQSLTKPTPTKARVSLSVAFEPRLLGMHGIVMVTAIALVVGSRWAWSWGKRS